MSGLGGFGLYFGGANATDAARLPRTAIGHPPVGRYYVTIGGERIDQIALAAYGFQSGAVEAILIVNPRLADLPYNLPARLAVLIPDLLAPQSSRGGREVQLWG
jgi:phage tail protein X